ncbi:MAG: ABC transporter ATP-binding protein [Candidatus Aminicenantes bacterium]|nr:ABC transporter ATP-binding protein [Candidatus Aminicenantes bacterium]
MGISVNGISKKFGDFVAVDDVSFKVEAGELVALLGPSGSGKSTILRIIAGLETADSGEIYLTGKDVTAMATQKRRVGFVFQHYALFKHMDVAKNISFGLEIQKQKKTYTRDKVAELINLVKLNGYEKHYPDQLSGGQRQRVALARALATEPRVLLLDEPFGALDAKVRSNLAQWLREFHDKYEITSIFVTHDQNEAIEISDKIVLINRGRVEQYGNARDVYENPMSKFVASFIGQVNVLDAVVTNGRIFIKGTGSNIEPKTGDVLPDGNVVLLIRPEDIELIAAPVAYSLPFAIRMIHYRGSHYEVDFDAGEVSLSVIENKNKFNREQWRVGQKVYLSFKDYRIFEAEEGHARVREKLKELGYIE